MDVIFSFYSGILTDALIAGAVIGAAVGIVVFTASTASEGLHRVIIGILGGGIIMGAIQGVLISSAVGTGGSGINPLMQRQADAFGNLAVGGIILTVQAALIGGLFMVVSLAPWRAVKGAIAGAIVGTVAGAGAWGIVRLLKSSVPLVVFYALILGLVLFVLDNIPRGSS
jgi:hypothetical protein